MQIGVEMYSVGPVVAKTRKASFDPVVADRLLELLSTDDMFRDLFRRKPYQALAQVGFSPADREDWPDCFFGITLASKRQIAESRAEIRNMLLQGLNHTTPQLDARLCTAPRTKM